MSSHCLYSRCRSHANGTREFISRSKTKNQSITCSIMAETSLLCALTSFVTNSPTLLEVGELSRVGVSVLSALLTSDAEIERLTFRDDLPLVSPALASAIKRSSVRSLSLDTTDHGDLLRTVSDAMSPELEAFTMRNLNLTAAESEALGNAMIAHCPILTSLKVLRCGKFAVGLARGIENLTFLRTLWFFGNDIADPRLLVGALTGLKHLEELNLGNSGLTPAAVKELRPDLVGRLRVFDLTCNNLGDEGVAAIVDAFLACGAAATTKLQRLSLEGNGFGWIGGTKLAKLISRSPHLRSLEISRNPIQSSSAAAAIGNAIKSGCAPELRELSVAECKLGADGATTLFSPLCQARTTLRILRAGQNAVGVIAVLDSVRTCGRVIQELYLNEGGIGEAGAKELARALVSAIELQVLDISYNAEMGQTGATAVLKTLGQPGRRPMERIFLQHCNAGNAGAKALAKVIIDVGCEFVDISGNVVSAEGAGAIADALSTPGVHVNNLVLSDNPIGPVGVEQIANKVIRPNKAVEMLDIKNTSMEKQGAMAVALALRERDRSSGTLRNLALSEDECGEMGLKALLEVKDWIQDTQQGEMLWLG